MISELMKEKRKMMRLEKKLEIFPKIEAAEGVLAKEHVTNKSAHHSHEKGGLQGICLYSSLNLMLKLTPSKPGHLIVAHRIDFADKN